MIEEVRKKLFLLRDEKYKEFQTKLIPTADPDTFIGVRTPELRKYAKELADKANISEFIHNVPHRFFDENQLHAFIISMMKNYELCISELNLFLPYIDNWATCDQLSPTVFKKHKVQLIQHIKIWIQSDKTYTKRFGIKMLMQHFLDENFDPLYLSMVSDIKSEEYYVNMMIAWYFATALAKQYDSVLPYLKEKKLSLFTHNKTIQKAVESYRITLNQKNYLRRLRRAE